MLDARTDEPDSPGVGSGKPARREPRPLTFRLLRAVPVIVILGLLIHFLLPRLGTIEESVKTMRTLMPWAVGCAVAAEVLSYVANGALLQAVISLSGEKLALRRAAAIELGAGTVALVAAGALGFGAAIYRWTRNRGLSADSAMLASWLPSMFDAATLVLFALVSAVELLLLHRLSGATIIALVIVVSLLGIVIAGAIVLLARNDWLTAIAEKLTRIVKRVLPTADDSVLMDSAERAALTWKMMQRGGWVLPALYSLLFLAFDVVCLRLIFLAADQPISLAMLVAGYGVPMLLGRSSFLPGGIAVVEVAMAALYGQLGVPENVAVVVVLTYRLISFWLPALVGIPIAVTLHSRKHEASRSQ